MKQPSMKLQLQWIFHEIDFKMLPAKGQQFLLLYWRAYRDTNTQYSLKDIKLIQNQKTLSEATVIDIEIDIIISSILSFHLRDI